MGKLKKIWKEIWKGNRKGS